MKTVRIFISSPGDVAEERDKARQVIAALQRSYDDEILLLPVLWEDLAIPATASFQEGIEFILTERQRIDIAIFVLWSRLGSPLGNAITKRDGSPYLSGTEREFDLMLAAFEQSEGKTPVILAYTRDDVDGFSDRLDARTKEDDALAELIRQRKLVKHFVKERFHDGQGHNLRAYHTYREPVGFAQRLNVHLRGTIDDILGIESMSAEWEQAPYRSLEIFDIQHAPIFCGRDEETCDVLQRLRDQRDSDSKCSFVCIVGASGSGKSSLARAGVAATLLKGSFEDGIKEWRPAVLIPANAQGDLFSFLANELAVTLPELSQGVGGLKKLVKCFEDRNDEASGILIETAFNLARTRLGAPLRLLFVLDQMEELWTDRNITFEYRENFLQVIEFLARTGCISVLATLRSDFYPQAQLSETFLRMKNERGHFDLTLPKAASRQQMIVQPARRAGLRFERDPVTGRTLDQLILEDSAADHSVLPLLQYCLNSLYVERDPSKRLLTFAAYKEMGGVIGALAKNATATYNDLSREARDELPNILPLLVWVNPEGDQSAVRRRCPISDLGGNEPGERNPRADLVKALIAKRFVVTDVHGGVAIATLAHEALLSRWELISTWIRSNHEFLRMRSQVEQAQARWTHLGKDETLLLAEGIALDEGRRLLREARHLLTPETIRYIESSIVRSLETALLSGDGMHEISDTISRYHYDVWQEVINDAFTSKHTDSRRNVCLILARHPSDQFQTALLKLILSDENESVLNATAQALVALGKPGAYDYIVSFGEDVRSKNLTAEARTALAQMLAVSEMLAQRPHFADWFANQPGWVTRLTRLHSYWLRLRTALPTFIFILVPAMVFAVLGAASVKWLPSALNFSCVQATPSLAMGLFHAAPSGIILGGGIVFGLILYRMVFGREYEKASMWQPWPALLFGTAFGCFFGLLCVAMIALVYQPEALHQIGWTALEKKPDNWSLLSNLFIGNRCGFAFPLTSIGLGAAFAMMTNSLRASSQWSAFLSSQSAITSMNQLAKVIAGTIRCTLPFALPIPLLVSVMALVALIVMNGRDFRFDGTTLDGLSRVFWGGFDEDVSHRIAWKASLAGRAFGLFGDCLAKIVGGYFCIVGMGVGIVALRHGIRIEPKKV